MEESSTIKLLSAIAQQLDSLEDSFYDDIPRELLKNTHLRYFSNIMNLVHSNVINLIKNSIQDVDGNKMRNLDNINVNYSQLEALSKKY